MSLLTPILREELKVGCKRPRSLSLKESFLTNIWFAVNNDDLELFKTTWPLIFDPQIQEKVWQLVIQQQREAMMIVILHKFPLCRGSLNWGLNELCRNESVTMATSLLKQRIDLNIFMGLKICCRRNHLSMAVLLWAHHVEYHDRNLMALWPCLLQAARYHARQILWYFWSEGYRLPLDYQPSNTTAKTDLKILRLYEELFAVITLNVSLSKTIGEKKFHKFFIAEKWKIMKLLIKIGRKFI